jgi:hypothetical protein
MVSFTDDISSNRAATAFWFLLNASSTKKIKGARIFVSF